MENNKQAEYPEYIKELMRPTPSSIAKLIAAWSGLSTETQILILSKLDEIRAPAYLAEKVRINALDSENAYVRYLAAKKFYFINDCSDEEELIKKKIENDPNPLVKYSLLEYFYYGSFEDADAFFALPHEARLAKIRVVGPGGMAALFAQAADKHLKEGKISEIELYEILTDFLSKPEFHEEYTDTRVSYDGEIEYWKEKDIESLWQLVPKLPEWVSHVLIENLPGASGLTTVIPEDVINSMTDHQLETLLYRKDIGLKKLRKKLFWEAGEARDRIKSAAVSFNFNLEYDEFAKILAKPPEERVSILKDLGVAAEQLSLCYYDAIHDALFAPTVSPFDLEDAFDLEDVIFARNALRRLNELEGWRREKELSELRLYRLAKRAVPWDSKEEGYAPSGELEFLSEKIVPGDTWATFIRFAEVWSNRAYWGGDLDKHLPRIDEIDEDDWEPEEPEGVNVELIKGIDAKLTELQEQSEGLQAELSKLEASVNRQRLIMYVLLGVAWLLLVQY